MQECKDAIRDMKQNTSPVLDDIQNDFFKHFGMIYMKCLIVYKGINKKSNAFFSKTFFNFINPQKRRERFAKENYRQISLTNSDYNIIAFIFAENMG